MASTGPLFGGASWPIGYQVGFLEKPFDEVLAVTRSWLKQRGEQPRETALGLQPLIDHLLRLAPLQMPAGRELLVETTGGWTMHADNSRGGGDSVSWVGYLSGLLSCRGVVARHIPIDQDVYPSTQFELLGPTGEAPLMYVRTITAGIYDEDRWRFETHGEVQPFEDLAAYRARRIRDRFDRTLLLRYLEALGITADDPGSFRSAVLYEDATTPRWTANIADVRKERAPRAKAPLRHIRPISTSADAPLSRAG